MIGIKGHKVTLPCEHEDGEIFSIKFSQSEFIPVCPTEECSGRVFKQGACDVVIEDLRFSDAGKYILRVYYSNDEAELKRQIRTYQLCVQGKDKPSACAFCFSFSNSIACSQCNTQA